MWHMWMVGQTAGRTDKWLVGSLVNYSLLQYVYYFLWTFFQQRDNVVRPTTIIGRIADDIQHNLG